jgi:hypothetical protein
VGSGRVSELALLHIDFMVDERVFAHAHARADSSMLHVSDLSYVTYGVA